MQSHSRSVCGFISVLCLPVFLAISDAASTDTAPIAVNPPPKAFVDALQLREKTAAAIAAQTEKPQAAMLRLKALGSLSGMPMEADADFAFAMVDIGQRLIALKKPVEAEVLFAAAEKTLAGLISRTPDKEAQTKAMFLQQIGFVRGHYLNESDQAAQDLAEAVKLQPDNKYLRQSRDSFAHEHATMGVKK